MKKTMNQRKIKMIAGGEVVAVFSSLKEAQRVTGIPASNISANAKGKLQTCGKGMRFVYASEGDELMGLQIPHATNVEFDTPRLPLTYRFIISHHKRAIEAVAWARDKYADLDDMLTALSGEDVEVTGCGQITVAFKSGFTFSLPEEELTDEFLLKLTRLIISCSSVSEISGDWYRGVYDGQYIEIEKNVDSRKNAI